MSERRTIGEILMSTGRISEEDVQAALAHQQENGGYFGEALVALGFVSQEELEWSLASQFDIPYVFPEADSIDPDAVALVTPEWALANLTLPIMKTRDTLTVVVDSPIKAEQVDVLRTKTELEIDLALCSAGRIRELVRQVFARQAAEEMAGEEIPAAGTLHEVLSQVQDLRSGRFGVASRGPRAWLWYQEHGKMHRRLLRGPWKSELDELFSPPPSGLAEGQGRANWSAQFTVDDLTTHVECHSLSSPRGTELLIEPSDEYSRVGDRFPRPPAGILSEIRILARSGSARFLVQSEPPSLGREILPHLPDLLLEREWRTLHLTVEDEEALGEVFCVKLPQDAEGMKKQIASLRPFHFDVVTAALSGSVAAWASDILDLASAAFLLWEEEDVRRVAQEAGVRWEIKIEEQEGEHLEWSLEPLNV